jgi:hypothetical protein
MFVRRSTVTLLLLLLGFAALPARAHVVYAATARRITLTVGGTASVFQPDFAGDWSTQSPYYPVAKASNFPLIGAGAYVDLKLSRWVQVEAEGRWQRFNQYANISQDNYLIGPRVPIHTFWRTTVYGKALVGFSAMTFDSFGNHGQFTDIAMGGGADIKLTRRISLRAVDMEYQYWPTWGNATLAPYGVSAGIGYRIF